MNRAIARAVTSAATFAGAAALCMMWAGARRHHRQKKNGELHSQLKTWEGEGGNLSPAAPAAPPPAG